MEDFLVYVVMGLIALLGFGIFLEKPTQDRAASRRYLLLVVVVVAEVVLVLFGKGIFNLIFGGG